MLVVKAVASLNLRFPFVVQYLSVFHIISLCVSVVAGTYLLLSRGSSTGLESGTQPRVYYVSEISSAFRISTSSHMFLVLLSMSNNLLCSGAQHDTHTGAGAVVAVAVRRPYMPMAMGV